MFRQRFVKTHVAFFADNLLQLFGDDQIGRENRELLVNIAGAEAQDEIAGSDHVPDIAMNAIEPRLIGHAAMAVREISSTIVCPLMPGMRRFARRINIGHDNAIGVIEGAPNSCRNALVRE